MGTMYGLDRRMPINEEERRDRAKKWRAHVDRGGRRKKGKRGR